MFRSITVDDSTTITGTELSIYSGILTFSHESIGDGIPCGKIDAPAGIILGKPIQSPLNIIDLAGEHQIPVEIGTKNVNDYPTGYINFDGPKFELPGGYTYDVELGTEIDGYNVTLRGGNVQCLSNDSRNMLVSIGDHRGEVDTEYGVVITHNYTPNSDDADKTFKALEITNKNGAGLTITLSGGYNGRPTTILEPNSDNAIMEIRRAQLVDCIDVNGKPITESFGNLTFSGDKILAGGTLNSNAPDVFVDIHDAQYPTGSEIALSVYDNGIRIANTNSELGAIAGYEIKMTAPKVSISDTFVIPVYTTDDAGNYTKVNNETKTVRCVKQVLSDGTATYTLELA